MMKKPDPPISYRSSGVNIDSMDEAIRGIRDLAASTFGPEVLAGVGGFGGIFRPALKGFEDPVLVASADGVGTKIKVAARMGVYDSVGRDLVNHCVNDILCQGAVPLFFMDYVAVGKLEAARIRELVAGVAEACRDAGCALLGGETAEMPGLYAPGEFDLAGFIVGSADRKNLVDGSRIAPGDLLLGLPASGMHTNGYSLARKLFFEILGWNPQDRIDSFGRTLGEELLVPHRCYLPEVKPFLEKGWIRGIAHITGGGITDNLPRILPENCRAVVNRGSWPVLPVFSLIQEKGGVEPEEMYRAFNMGVGMILVAEPGNAAKIVDNLGSQGQEVHSIGCIEVGSPGVEYREEK